MGFYGYRDFLTGEEIVVNTSGQSKWSRPPTYKLYPCPKCGTTQATYGASQSETCVNLMGIFAEGQSGWIISCRNCSYSYPEPVSSPQEAINEWNKNCEVISNCKTLDRERIETGTV